MLRKNYKYYFSLIVFFKSGILCFAQIIPANIIYQQSFGQGTGDPTIPGPPLPVRATDFTYSSSTCPPPGSYTIVWATPATSCFNNEWIFLTHDRDHELNPSLDFGMMMLVNDTSFPTNKTVYVDTVNENLCFDIVYHFSFAVINIDNESDCTYGPDFPVFEFRIEDGSGQLIKKDTTRPGVHYAGPLKKFSTYGFDFIVPNGVSKLVPKITLLKSTYWCAEDFAMDDISIATVGPPAKIAFDDEPPATIVKSVCFQQNKVISMTGDAAYPAQQWQQSTDNGITWTDIPGATTANYSRVFSEPDTFLFRLSEAESINIGNSNCRIVSNSLKIEVDGIPTNLKATNNSPVCSGSELIFKVTGNGASFIWTGPNGFYDDISYPEIYFSSLSDSGMYYVEMTTLGGCQARDSTYVTMIGTDVHAGPDTLICKGRSVQLKASRGVSYSWSPSNGLSNASVNNPLAKPDITTVYTVTVTDSDGCSDTANVRIKVINKIEVKAGISGTDYLCRSYDSASFKDISSGKIIKWNWNFDNGQTDTTAIPPVQYYLINGNENSYRIRLAVADTAGCTDTAYHFIKVEDNCYIAVPTAFTPNGDGLNDYLYPLNAYKATNLLFRVYSRNGQLVFETRDWARKWDGTVRGIQQASGVYVWMLEYNDASNKKISLKGTTLLIR
jgi:gliding motility-associated-like protein